jgi:hypothetical protein
MGPWRECTEVGAHHSTCLSSQGGHDGGRTESPFRPGATPSRGPSLAGTPS